MQEMRVWSLGWEDPLEKEMETHSRTCAWKIPWTEEPGGLYIQSMGSQWVGHNLATKQQQQVSLCHSYRPIPVIFHPVSLSLPTFGQLVGYPANRLSWNSFPVFLGCTFCSSYAQNAVWYSNNILLMVLILRFTPVLNSFGDSVWHWEKASECESELRVPALTQPQRTHDVENPLPSLTVNLHI